MFKFAVFALELNLISMELQEEIELTIPDINKDGNLIDKKTSLNNLFLW